MTPLAASLPPTGDARATPLAGRAISRWQLAAVVAIFPGEAFPLGLQNQSSRQLFAQGLHLCSQGGRFGLQLGDAFFPSHASLLAHKEDLEILFVF